MFDPIEFGKRVQKARLLKGFTQEQLAERLAVGRPQITRIERGARACSLDLLIELATELNTSLDYLLIGAEQIPLIKENLQNVIEAIQKVVDTL